ncbi:large ribosomal subunit protein uL10m [Acipenser ruthenus]|uniref:large ribosomal subunit protein uL10m n=1 Tax=Acipenser ruthenus TaxID=7906 RepID=UPI002741216F|nr:large ribosomal subunit protein uL10m [Acipenser ruthenus]
MATTLCSRAVQKLGWLPCTQSVRHGSKSVTRHRKPVHFLKQKLMALTQYIPPQPAVSERCIIPPSKQVQEESGLTRLLKREVEALFRDNKMVAVFQNNAVTAEDMLQLKHRLMKHGIAVKFYPNQVARSYLSDSKYSNLLPLFIGQNILLVSREPKVKEMLQTLRTMPHIILLGACVEDALLSRQGVLNYSKLPSLAVIQGEVVGGLSLMTSQTASLLQHHPLQLSRLLQQYVKQQSEGDGGETEGAEAQ